MERKEQLSELERIYGPGVLAETTRMHEELLGKEQKGDFLDQVITERTQENPDFPAMVDAAALRD